MLRLANIYWRFNVGFLLAAIGVWNPVAADKRSTDADKPILRHEAKDVRRWGLRASAGKITQDASNHIAQNAEDIVMIDAGSSGCKLFAFSPKKTGSKLSTECTAKHQKEGRTNRGVAALAYSQEECEWQVSAKGEKPKPLKRPDPDFVQKMLQELAKTYTDGSGKKDLTQVRNRNSVPILATAGMRLVSESDNKKVWSYLCGRSHAGLTLAPFGEKCGTAPGTKEAYYEFLANAVKGESKTLTGTFTIGGASAQIAIPLKTKRDKTSFLALRDAVGAELDCTKLLLPSGERAPIFNTIREGGPKMECVDDYITYMPKEKIVASSTVEGDNIKVSDIEGLGLISFLGLQGRGSFVAGGVNEIAEWASERNCDTNKTTFCDCVNKLQAALSKDILWKHVTNYFRDHNLKIDEFSYNTFAAVPKVTGLPDVDGKDQGWELERELWHICGPNNGARFGYKNSVTCMKAYYTSMYITSFFAEKSSDNKRHTASELNFDPTRDWSEGLFEETMASSASSAASLLKVLLPRHSFTYMDGARMHLHPESGNYAQP